MPKIAKTFKQKNLKQDFLSHIKLVKGKLADSKANKAGAIQLTAQDRDQDLSLFDKIINNCVLVPHSNYFASDIEENVDKLQTHYQKKFQETGKKEYDIKVIDLGNENFVQLIAQNTPKAGELPKGVVIVDGHFSHAICALISHDDKLYVQDLSQEDGDMRYSITEYLSDAESNKQVVSLKNYGMDAEEESPQKAGSGCVVFAFKYAKTLLSNNGKLFKTLKPTQDDDENAVCILSPDLLKYAQSETVVQKAMNNYKTQFGLSDEKIQEVTNYRNTHYGKFRILYHQLKYFPKSDNN